ncbi:BTB/POZ domain-containing protein 9-like [Drosophila miranda]|uniref:BTB/POZ domain-containing protein 9-like n=1 Tax=Drosophila miranda TaxID=7229 RepID=UPI0007E77CFB|nr:BTB/POZ domain-containing protein 9-like [Drosophila miranda]
MSSQESDTSCLGSVPAKRRCTETDDTTIIFAERALADMGRLCMNELYSDVTLLVEDERLPAHCMILAARSEYFRAMLYGPMCESMEREIPMVVPLDAFKVILGYFYSGKIRISTLDVVATLKVLGLANMYGLVEVESALSDHLQEHLNVCNVCMILDAARLYHLENLTGNCLTFMDKNGSEMIEHESFLTLSKDSLEEVLRRDTFIADELYIFLCILQWSQQNPNSDIKSVVSLVRLPLMSVDQLLDNVRPRGIFGAEKILDAINEGITIDSVNLPYRAVVCPGEDVTSSEKHQASRSVINDNEISIELRCWYKINTISILGTFDRTVNSLQCAAEVSCDMTKWTRLGTTRFTLSPTWQNIKFTTQAVRFIRIVHPESGRKNILKYVQLKAFLDNTENTVP